MGQYSDDDGWWCSWCYTVSEGRGWSLNRIGCCVVQAEQAKSHGVTIMHRWVHEGIFQETARMSWQVGTKFTHKLYNEAPHISLRLGREVLVQVVWGVQRSNRSSSVEGDWVQRCRGSSSWHETWHIGRRCRSAGSETHAVNISQKDNSWKLHMNASTVLSTNQSFYK